MKRKLITTLAATLVGLGLSLPAHAEPPRVVASIVPLHSLAASVMDGVAEPKRLLPGGASPHTYNLRPSEADMLSKAELVIWVGPELESFLERPLRNLAADAEVLEVAGLEGIRLLDTRDGGQWDSHHHHHDGGDDHNHGHDDHHDHGHDHDDQHDHGHSDDHDHGHGHNGDHGHAHDDEHGHGHGHDHDGDHGHDHHHGEHDMHLWLSPDVARAFVTALSEKLKAMDPDNAATYRDNAEATLSRIDELDNRLAERLAPLADHAYLVFHDAYQYFEAHYGLSPVGSVTVNPERQPSARRLSELRQRIRDTDARCVFAEPQFRPSLVETLVEDTDAEGGVLDPLGAELAPGPDAWFELMENMASDLEACLARD
ncbi:zinc transport system substrate-binding protein [Alkalispirillum mobile]|uniref:High-affinity zinc uptake system protein ZnuA n=1 Tax=Alkalispirillum mobile TaxID=85925 RepID=A0A498C3S7_9GAMM|nr:zinc ABC transporter substrate-binding protein ZnuA [Alkalispirillum mobile]RLK50162.1 zinc transport system substrate-binding protein [Alkalispirillum mobile]